MKKLFALLIAFCMMTACLVTVHADNYHLTATVDLDGFKTFRIPEPEGEVDPDTAYFTHEFTFTAKIDGSYCFHISVEEDEDDPYVYTLDVDCPTGYWDLGEGIAFQGKAGETYTVRFQYPTDDGRYPAFDYFMIYEPNHNVRDSLSLGESKTIQIPEPVDGVVDPGWTYYNLSFFFTPEKSGTYRFLADYDQDASDPYEIYMGVAGPYWELDNGIEFNAEAGETYELSFQYPNHDGRYPEFTFWVEAGTDPVYMDTGADPFYEDTIALGETKTITIPTEDVGYFSQTFWFTPEESGAYRFLVSYQEDEQNPYEFYMDVAGPYWELENGIEFDAEAGIAYDLCFQYPQQDGRSPTFTFYVCAADGTQVPIPSMAVPETEAPETVPETIPETEPTAEETPVGIDGKTILCCIGAVLLVGAAIALVILERKKNTSSDSL